MLVIIYFGILAIKEGFNKIIHRTDRCDLSLSQLGFRLLDHFLNNGKKIPYNPDLTVHAISSLKILEIGTVDLKSCQYIYPF